ncbi:MAG: hypothetical protein LBL48_09360 [Azoarcus sp.]|nr:hypothetical protein [Azoarcus sp.]
MAETQAVVVKAHSVEAQHTTIIQAYDDGDYVTVVGCSNPGIVDSWSFRVILGNIKSQVESGQAGDRAMFVNQGIRQVREYQKRRKDQQEKKDKGRQDRSVFFIFRENYEPQALTKIKSIVKDRYGAEFAILDNIGELVNFVNSRRNKKRFIKQMDFYSHGLVGAIEFGYDTDKADSYRFGHVQARLLKPEMFHDDAVVMSYACRTGIAVDRDSFADGTSPQYDKSLAQTLADCADVEVHAFLRRTDYRQTYGNKAQSETAAKTKNKVLEYDLKMSQFDKLLTDYHKIMARRQKLLEAYRRSSGNPDVQAIPGMPAEPSPPQSPEKDFSEEEEELARAEIARQKNQWDYNLPIDPYGAVNPVGTFGTPEGLPEGKRVFTPVAWETKKRDSA